LPVVWVLFAHAHQNAVFGMFDVLPDVCVQQSDAIAQLASTEREVIVQNPVLPSIQVELRCEVFDS
jgi:hypothetical protein